MPQSRSRMYIVGIRRDVLSAKYQVAVGLRGAEGLDARGFSGQSRCPKSPLRLCRRHGLFAAVSVEVGEAEEARACSGAGAPHVPLSF